MLRFPFLPVVAAWGVACASGCFGSVDTSAECELSLGSPQADVHGLENRYALGTRTTVRLSGSAPLSLESTDPDVVRVDKVTGNVATLSFVGEGRATLVARNDVSTEEQGVEVVRHASFTVVLSEYGAIPLGALSEQVLLAGPQYILVIYLDSNGRQLYGDGLAELSWSAGLERCDGGLHRLELHCFIADQAGKHDLAVRVQGEELELSFETVSQSELVGIEVLQADEDELRPGTWAQIDVVGVTRDGRHVSSVHPLFQTTEQEYIGYFAYQYDPDAPPETLEIEAMQWRERTTFHGVPSEETAFGCRREDGGDASPIPAAASLLGMVIFVRLGSRRRRGF